MPDYVDGRRVIHVRKDGTRQDSMEGVEVPYNSQTAPFYHFLKRCALGEFEKGGEPKCE